MSPEAKPAMLRQILDLWREELWRALAPPVSELIVTVASPSTKLKQLADEIARIDVELRHNASHRHRFAVRGTLPRGITKRRSVDGPLPHTDARPLYRGSS